MTRIVQKIAVASGLTVAAFLPLACNGILGTVDLYDAVDPDAASRDTDASPLGDGAEGAEASNGGDAAAPLCPFAACPCTETYCAPAVISPAYYAIAGAVADSASVYLAAAGDGVIRVSKTGNGGDGTAVVVYTPVATGQIEAIARTPTGLVFGEQISGSKTNIWTSNVDGSHPVKIATLSANVDDIKLTTDRIYVQLDSGVVSMKLDGTSMMSLPGSSVLSLETSGPNVFVSDEFSDLFRYTSGSSSVSATYSDGVSSLAGVHSDGTSLFFFYPSTASGVLTLPVLFTSRDTPVHVTANAIVSAIAPSPTRDFLYFATSSAGTQILRCEESDCIHQVTTLQATSGAVSWLEGDANAVYYVQALPGASMQYGLARFWLTAAH